MKHHKSINQLILVNRVLGIGGNQLAHKGSTVNEHSLVCSRRAKFESLSPVRSSLLVALLLVILLVIGEILDTLCAVCAVLALGECCCRAQHHCD